MNLILTVDHHFVETPDGKVWCSSIHNSDFWERYTSEFEKVYVICRYRKTKSYDEVENFLLSSIENVEFIGISDFTGPIDYGIHFYKIRNEVIEKLDPIKNYVIIYRLPSTIGFLVYNILKNKKNIFGVELVADPNTAYRRKKSLLHFLISKHYARLTKSICLKASAVGYVTASYLQSIYPTNGFKTSYSSISLSKSDFSKKELVYDPIKFIHVSNLNSDIKGHDTLLKALDLLKQEGHQFECTIIGDGRFMNTFKRMASDLNLSSEVVFTGALSEYDEIKEFLTDSDIFVFPSHSEGLPRAVIEAMSCSLVVVASPVGGTAELLEPEYLISYDNIEGYYKVMKQLILNNEKILKIGRRNYTKALEYSDEILSKKRNTMFRELIDMKEGKK